MSNADHPSEVLYREANFVGRIAAVGMRMAVMCDSDVLTQSAVGNAIEAASLYHEAQREAGECPMCGGINTDPWGGVHRNESLGCCIEPPERTFDEALAIKYPKETTTI